MPLARTLAAGALTLAAGLALTAAPAQAAGTASIAWLPGTVTYVDGHTAVTPPFPYSCKPGQTLRAIGEMTATGDGDSAFLFNESIMFNVYRAPALTCDGRRHKVALVMVNDERHSDLFRGPATLRVRLCNPDMSVYSDEAVARRSRAVNVV